MTDSKFQQKLLCTRYLNNFRFQSTLVESKLRSFELLFWILPSVTLSACVKMTTTELPERNLSNRRSERDRDEWVGTYNFNIK